MLIKIIFGLVNVMPFVPIGLVNVIPFVPIGLVNVMPFVPMYTFVKYR